MNVSRHPIAVGFVVILQLSIVGLGALRGCLGAEHTHAGQAAPDCPMHHHQQSNAPSSASHSHDHHRHAAPANTEASKRMTCGCSSDTTSMYIGPTAILCSVAAVLPSMHVVVLEAQAGSPATDLWLPSDSPPPRSILPQLS